MVKCTHLSIFSSHTVFFSPSQISLTPESSRRLLFRFISFRMVLEERTVARTEQLFSVSSQLFSLNTKTALVIIQHIFNTHQTRACERSGAWSVRGAERAKYSRCAERVFIQRPERSLCLAPVPLRYRSHHEPRACTNPPRIHLCLQ